MDVNMGQGILAVIVAHNELDSVKVNVQILLNELEGTASEIVIVDNCSDDGLQEWLSAQNQVSYIVCDEKPEGYGNILEVVRKQFGNGRDLLLLRANYFFTPGSIALMRAGLYSKEEIAAVGPVGNLFFGEQKESVGNAYAEAVSIQATLGSDIVETAYLDLDVMLVKADATEYFNCDIAVPPAVMRSWMREVIKRGRCLAVVKSAVCFAAVNTDDEIYRAFAPELYKREKLHQLLHSFGDVAYQGVYLYKYLEPDILAGINKINKFQDNIKNKKFVTWNTDGVLLSTDEEAEEFKEQMGRLPQKDVLFVTLPLRRGYQGAYVHTAVEGYISCLDEAQYMDLELIVRKDGKEYIPTKNRYPILNAAIPTVYGIKETDKQELADFLWSRFIYPLEQVLDIKFPEENIKFCIWKASYIMKQRDGYRKFYMDVIERVKPKVIVYSHGQDPILAYLRDTTLELGIPTLEIQHGVGIVDTYHKNLVYADGLIVYSEIEALKCREQGNGSALAIGKPGVYDNISRPEYKYPVTVISFISSMESEICTYALNLAKRLDSQKYQVVYKMHNVEKWNEEEERQVVEMGSLHLLPGFLDIREVIELSDIVVGIRSSGIFDALVYPNVKIVVVKDKAVNYSESGVKEVLQGVADTGDIVMVENEDELYQEVLSYERNTMYRGAINNFWIADGQERFRKLIGDYL